MIKDAGSLAHWAIAHNSTFSARSRRWYYLARVIKIDGQWFQLYRQPILGSHSKNEMLLEGVKLGYKLLPGVFSPGPSPRYGDTMVWSEETNVIKMAAS